MSHLQGTSYVGSMVVFEDALAREARLPALHGQDRPRATTTSARCARSSTAGSRHWRDEPGGDRFGANPDLLVVDGGLGQLHAARRRGRGPRRHRRARARLARQATRGGLPAGLLAPRRAAADERGAVPAPARARRGAPLRHLLPPLDAGTSHDRVAARRHRGPRARRDASGWSRRSAPSPQVRAASLEELRALRWLPDDVARRVHDRLSTGAIGVLGRRAMMEAWPTY